MCPGGDPQPLRARPRGRSRRCRRRPGRVHQRARTPCRPRQVNGRVFVNNVSLGVYAEAVQSEGYRDAKLRTIADTVPMAIGPGEQPLDLEWTGADGQRSQYGRGRARLQWLLSPWPGLGFGHATAIGRRCSWDHRRYRGAANTAGPIAEWSATTFEVSSGVPIAAGIDGEAATIDPPLKFESRPRALRVLIAPQHPGASPSATIPAGRWDALRAIAKVAIHGAT